MAHTARRMWTGNDEGGPGERGALNVDAWRREAAPARTTGVLDLAEPDARTAFGAMLTGWPWHHYVTWTFRDRVGPVKAEREVRAWLKWAEYHHGSRGLAWMFGTEQEPGADRPHAHGLMIGTRGLFFDPLWKAWFRRNGAMKSEVPRSGVACAFYCTKYVVKRGEVFFSDNLETFRPGDAATAARARRHHEGGQLALGSR